MDFLVWLNRTRPAGGLYWRPVPKALPAPLPTSIYSLGARLLALCLLTRRDPTCQGTKVPCAVEHHPIRAGSARPYVLDTTANCFAIGELRSPRRVEDVTGTRPGLNNSATARDCAPSLARLTVKSAIPGRQRLHRCVRFKRLRPYEAESGDERPAAFSEPPSMGLPARIRAHRCARRGGRFPRTS
jgi:hypothetical protein